MGGFRVGGVLLLFVSYYCFFFFGGGGGFCVWRSGLAVLKGSGFRGLGV